MVSAKPISRSTVSANSAAPRGPWRSWPSMKRGLTARARTTRATASASERARGRAGSVVSSVDHVGLAAERRHSGREAADEGDVGGAFEQVAARIVAGMHQERRLRDASGEQRRGGRPLAFGAAIGMGGALQIGAAEFVARLPVAGSEQGFRAGAIGAGRGAEDAGPQPAEAEPLGGQRILGAILGAAGDGAGGGVDERDLCREHVAEEARDAPGDVDPRAADSARAAAPRCR